MPMSGRRGPVVRVCWHAEPVHYAEPPRWQFYPGNARPTPALRELVDALAAEATWLRDHWWTAPKTDTKAITRRLERHLPPSGSTAGGPYGLRQGWNLETREHYAKIPYLYGEGDESPWRSAARRSVRRRRRTAHPRRS